MAARAARQPGLALSYRPLPTPLHAARASCAAAWVGAVIAAALLLRHPLVLGTLAVALSAAALATGVAARLRGTLRAALVVGVPIVLVNVLVSRQGLTVFARLGDLGPFGQGELTVEALAYGAVIAVKVTLLMVVTALASIAVDPDELLRICRRLSFRSAVTASLALRMVPLLGADAARIAEAQQTRAERVGGPRARALVLGAVVGGALDRAMDVAATLELRGLAAGPLPRSRARILQRTRGQPQRATVVGAARPALSRHDLAFLLSALVVVALAAAGRWLGLEAFSAYPLLHAPVSAATLALCAGLLAAVVLPFLDRRGV